jgi:hypothetical protein
MAQEGSHRHSTYGYGKLPCNPERAQGGRQAAAREGSRRLGEGFRSTDGAVRGGLEQARGGRPERWLDLRISQWHVCSSKTGGKVKFLRIRSGSGEEFSINLSNYQSCSWAW